MKTEINSQNKARFFAQYYGQEVMMYDNSEGDKFWEKQIYPIDAKNLACDLSYMHMVLKSLNSISDEDAEAISKIGLPDRLYDHLWGKFTGFKIADSINGGRQTNTFFPTFRFADTIDYLRYKGYALDWMGLSVEEMVHAGWITLINN